MNKKQKREALAAFADLLAATGSNPSEEEDTDATLAVENNGTQSDNDSYTEPFAAFLNKPAKFAIGGFHHAYVVIDAAFHLADIQWHTHTGEGPLGRAQPHGSSGHDLTAASLNVSTREVKAALQWQDVYLYYKFGLEYPFMTQCHFQHEASFIPYYGWSRSSVSQNLTHATLDTMVITYSRVLWINRVRLSILLVVS